MSNSINEYMETDLGNVSPNPRGYYNSTSEYEYLDLIEFEGGSYICVIELGSTVKGIAPTPGTSTTVWQCIAIPGDLTPEYQRIYEDVINKHQEVQNNTVHVNEVKSYLDTLKQNIENEVADANTSADNAKTSELKAKTSEELAKNAQTLAENSNKETNKTISDFNDNLQNVIDESVNTINQSKENAITTINEQKERSVLEVQTETSQYIADEKNIAMQEIHDAIDDFNSTTDAKRTDIIASGDEKINTMNEILKDVTDIQNKVQTTETSTKEYASNAQKSAENAEFSKLSAKAIEDSVIEKGNSIESIHNQILLDKNAVSADKVAVSEMKTSVANISQEIIDKKTEAIAAIEEYGAVQVSATQPTSEHVDLWIDDTSEEEYSLPEIKDNEINETDTWSSQKIDNEIGELKSDLSTATTIIIAVEKDVDNLKNDLADFLPGAGENLLKDVTQTSGYIVWNKSNGQPSSAYPDYKYYDYVQIKPNTIYELNMDGKFSNFYDENKNYISTATTITFVTPSNAKYIIISCVNTETITLIESGRSNIKDDIEKLKSNNTYKTYVVDINGNGDFTSVLEACVNAVKTINSRVLIKKGTYDIKAEALALYGSSYTGAGVYLQNGIHIIGDSDAYLICDNRGGSDTFRENFSIFNAGSGDFILENINMVGYNIRYNVHDERGHSDDESANHKFIGCYMYLDNQEYNSSHPNTVKWQCIGGGLGKRANILVESCIFESIGATSTDGIVSYHGNGAGESVGTIVIKDNYFKTGTVRFGDYGTHSKKTNCIVSNNKLCGEIIHAPEITGQNLNHFDVYAWGNIIE